MERSVTAFSAASATPGAIASVADDGAGIAVITTSGAHGLVASDLIRITGTTSYNGNHIVLSAPSATTFKVAALAYVADETGTLYLRHSERTNGAYASMHLQLTLSATGTVLVQASNDNSTYTTLATYTQSGIWTLPVGYNYIMCLVQTNGGTVTMDYLLSEVPASVAAGGTVYGNVTVQSDSTPTLTVKSTQESDTDGGRRARVEFEHQNGGTAYTGARIQSSHDETGDDTKNDLILYTHNGTSLTEAMRLDSSQNMETKGNVYPQTTDVGSLGTATKMFADLFLASGGVVNWDNGNVTITHAAGKATLAGGEWHTSGDVVLGTGDGGLTAPTGKSLQAPDVTTGGAGNVAGADIAIQAGIGTGTGDEGVINFDLPIQAAAGDNIQTRATRLTLDMAGSSTVLTANAAQAWTMSTAAGAITISPTEGLNLNVGAGNLGTLKVAGTTYYIWNTTEFRPNGTTWNCGTASYYWNAVNGKNFIARNTNQDAGTGTATLTAAKIQAGLYENANGAGAETVTTDTSSNIWTTVFGSAKGVCSVWLMNTGSNNITLAAGTTVTLLTPNAVGADYVIAAGKVAKLTFIGYSSSDVRCMIQEFN